MDDNSRKVADQKLRTRLLARASTLGVPRSVYQPIVEIFLKWSSKSGEEWTVGQFKKLSSDFTQWLATGNRYPVPWVKASSSSHYCYSGPIGLLERWANKSNDRKIIAINLLKMSSSHVSGRVTPNQLHKFTSAVLAEGRKDYSFRFPKYDVAESDPIYGAYGFTTLGAFEREHLPAIFGSTGSPSKRGPIPGASVPECESFVDSVRFISDYSDGFHLYCKYKDIFSQVLGPDLDHRVRSTFGVDLKDNGFHVGRIGLIQEPGYKLRAVANPGRVFQFSLHKLGTGLYEGLRVLPWDCTFDQSKAIPVIQRALSNNQKAFCVDLRNATDYFPLSLQKQLILEVTPSSQEFLKHVKLWESISTSPWLLKGKQISWSVGQPLGLYPSFAAFAATHGFLLYELNNRVWDESWYVLGDDICILSEDLYIKYMKALDDIGCPTADEKTLSSHIVAEFAGKLITCDKVHPILKWREMSDDNFVDIARYLGPKSLSIMRPRQRRVLEKILSFPWEGPGWNPLGIPLQDRVDAELRFLSQSTDFTPELQTSRYPEMWRDVFTSDTFRYVREHFGEGFLSHVIPNDDLDQRSAKLVTETLGKQYNNIVHLVPANAQMVPGLSRFPSRARGVHEGRRTQLEILERKLKNI